MLRAPKCCSASVKTRPDKAPAAVAQATVAATEAAHHAVTVAMAGMVAAIAHPVKTAMASSNLHAPTVRAHLRVRAVAVAQAWASPLVSLTSPVLPARQQVNPIPCVPASI